MPWTRSPRPQGAGMANAETRRRYPELFIEDREVVIGFDADCEMDRIRWASTGFKTPLLRTVERCREQARPLPDWCAAAVLDLISNGPAKAGRGRNNSADARERQELVDLQRWFAVFWIKHGTDDLSERLARDGYATDWNNVYGTVSDLLSGEDFWGAPHAIRASYRKMNRGIKTPDFPALELD